MLERRIEEKMKEIYKEKRKNGCGHKRRHEDWTSEGQRNEKRREISKIGAKAGANGVQIDRKRQVQTSEEELHHPSSLKKMTRMMKF